MDTSLLWIRWFWNDSVAPFPCLYSPEQPNESETMWETGCPYLVTLVHIVFMNAIWSSTRAFPENMWVYGVCGLSNWTMHWWDLSKFPESVVYRTFCTCIVSSMSYAILCFARVFVHYIVIITIYIIIKNKKNNIVAIDVDKFSEAWWCIHDDVIKWKHFPRYCPFVRGNPSHKAQWCGALMFTLICA